MIRITRISGPPATGKRWPVHGRVRTSKKDPHRRAEYENCRHADNLQEEVAEVADYLQEEVQEEAAVDLQAAVRNRQEEVGAQGSLPLRLPLLPRRAGTMTTRGPCPGT